MCLRLHNNDKTFTLCQSKCAALFTTGYKRGARRDSSPVANYGRRAYYGPGTLFPLPLHCSIPVWYLVKGRACTFYSGIIITRDTDMEEYFAEHRLPEAKFPGATMTSGKDMSSLACLRGNLKCASSDFIKGLFTSCCKWNLMGELRRFIYMQILG